MNNTKFLKIIIAIMVVLNCGLMGFMFLKKPCGPPPHEHHKPPHPPRGNGVGELLENEVGFDASQLEEYQLLKQSHHEKIKALKEKMKPLREKYFDGLVHPISDNEKEELLQGITACQVQIEKLTFEYFSSIRDICSNEEQVDKYNELIQDISKMVAKPPKKPNK